MKRYSFLLMFCFFFSLISLFNACKKDKGSNNYLKGKIDGVSFECISNIRATPSGAGDKVIFFRGDWSTYSIQFYLDGNGSNITTGSYNFQTGNVYNVILYQDNVGYSAGYFCGFASPCSFGGSGKITLLEINKKHLKGTFQFVTSINGGASISKTVSDGEFYIDR